MRYNPEIILKISDFIFNVLVKNILEEKKIQVDVSTVKYNHIRK